MKDLLSEVATGSLQDGQSPGVYLCEDPICGMQVHQQTECTLNRTQLRVASCNVSALEYIFIWSVHGHPQSFYQFVLSFQPPAVGFLLSLEDEYTETLLRS